MCSSKKKHFMGLVPQRYFNGMIRTIRHYLLWIDNRRFHIFSTSTHLQNETDVYFRYLILFTRVGMLTVGNFRIDTPYYFFPYQYLRLHFQTVIHNRWKSNIQADQSNENRRWNVYSESNRKQTEIEFGKYLSMLCNWKEKLKISENRKE